MQAGTTSFGAFVNIGAPKAGLLHISQIVSFDLDSLHGTLFEEV